MAAKRFRLTTTNRSGAKRKMHKKASSELKTENGKWKMEDGESGERFVDCIFNYTKSN